jgi:hypothetical protein
MTASGLSLNVTEQWRITMFVLCLAITTYALHNQPVRSLTQDCPPGNTSMTKASNLEGIVARAG